MGFRDHRVPQGYLSFVSYTLVNNLEKVVKNMLISSVYFPKLRGSQIPPMAGT